MQGWWQEPETVHNLFIRFHKQHLLYENQIALKGWEYKCRLHYTENNPIILHQL
jgi:hypothetical protein